MSCATGKEQERVFSSTERLWGRLPPGFPIQLQGTELDSGVSQFNLSGFFITRMQGCEGASQRMTERELQTDEGYLKDVQGKKKREEKKKKI